MRRHLVDSVEGDDVAFKSSQGLKYSEHSSPQLENSQCSSFDIYSQMMSQQQVFNSQSSEAPQIAQKYYTKFSSKPSLFKGKEIIATDKHGLTRRRSFQDIQEFQKQRSKDKEDRDLLCTLVSLLKEGTDEIHQTAEKLHSDLGLQVANATVKLEEAIKKIHNFLHEFQTEVSCSVNDKLEGRESIEELQTKLREKEAVLQALREELERTKALKYDDLKSMIGEMWSVQQKDILLELKLQKETHGVHFSEHKESFSAFCEDFMVHMEDTIKSQLQKVAEICTTELIRKSSNHQHCNSHSSSVHQGSAFCVTSGLPVNNVQTNFTTSQTSPDYQQTNQLFNGPNTAARVLSSEAVMNSVGFDQTLMSSEDCSVPSEGGNVTSNCFGTNTLLLGTSRYLAPDRRHDGCHHPKEFTSPPVHPQYNTNTNAAPHFSRWTSKGPSPVAAVAPLVQDQVAKEQIYTSAKKHNNGPRKVKCNYQSTRRQSARLKQKNLSEKILPVPTEYAPRKRARNHQFGRRCTTEITSKSAVPSNAIQLQMTQTGEKGWKMDNLHYCKEGPSFSSTAAREKNPLSKVQSNKFNINVLYDDLCKRQRQNHSNLQMTSRVVTDKGFVAGSRCEPDHKSDKSSPETTVFSADLEDPASQDLFIDAIDGHIPASDEGFERRHFSVYSRSPHPSEQMETVAKQKSRAINKKRTLWSSGTMQNRDLFSFLTSSIKQRTNMV